MKYIESIEIKFWRHFEFDKELPLKTGVNLILGKNGSGKTSFLRMLHSASTRQNQILEGEAKEKEDGFILVNTTIHDETGKLIMTNTKSGTEGVWQNDALKDQIHYITSQRSIGSGHNAINPLANTNMGDISISLDPTQTIDVAEEFNKAIMKELFDRVIALSKSMEFLKELEENYQEGLVDFEKKLKIDPTKENAVYFVDYKDRVVSVNDLSSGEKEYLYFYAFLRRIQAEEGKIILIDEPELHLHSSQIRKLCELISNLATKNQVIIATHSGEILQHFISQANIVLLSKGVIEHIDNPEQMSKVLEETGLPIDPSVFTAHWICAENEPSKALTGGGATTPEVLSWIFGKDLKKRYWSFGSNRAVAQALGDGIEITASDANLKIEVTPILDGDKLIKAPTDYPIVSIPAPTKELCYFPFWELENIFLSEDILNTLLPSKEEVSGSDQFWSLMNSNKDKLLKTVKKTIAKNYLKQFSLDKFIGSNPDTEVNDWKNAVAGSSLDLSVVEEKFEQVISNKDWRWLPGKEALGLYITELLPDFWIKIRELQKLGKLKDLLEKDLKTKELIDAIKQF